MTDISRVTSSLDDIFKFAFKVMNLYSNEIGNINNKKTRMMIKNIFIAAGLNMIGKKIKENLVME